MNLGVLAHPWLQLSLGLFGSRPERARPDAARGAGQMDPLIGRAASGDRQAFDELFRRHVDEVHLRLTRLIGPDPEREDLVQEVFIAAYRGLADFRGDAAFSTWLYRIVVHAAYGHLRKRRRRPLELDALPELSLPGEKSPEATAARQELVREGLGLLARLKPKKRIAFVLREVEGLSLQEIGELVDATPAAVGQRVKHAHVELQAMLERQAAKQQRAKQQHEGRA